MTTGLVIAAVWVVAKLAVARFVVTRALAGRTSIPAVVILTGLTWAALPILLTASGIIPFEPVLFAGWIAISFTGAGTTTLLLLTPFLLRMAVQQCLIPLALAWAALPVVGALFGLLLTLAWTAPPAIALLTVAALSPLAAAGVVGWVAQRLRERAERPDSAQGGLQG
jgi:hypothetical protein